MASAPSGPVLSNGAKIKLIWRDKWLLLFSFYHLWKARARLTFRGFGDVRNGLEHAGPPVPAKLALRLRDSIFLASRAVIRPTCLVQAIAAQEVLAHKGFGSRICVGLRSEGKGHLEAHAWLTSADQEVIGTEIGVAKFRPLMGKP